MEQFEYRKDAELGKKKNPSYWEGEPEYTPITRIRMSCGGGMGGAQWFEYIYRLGKIPSNTIMKVKRYDGKVISLNTSYVVSAEDFTLAKAELNISEWRAITRDYSKDDIETYYVLIDDGAELKLK